MCCALSAQQSLRKHCEKTACRDECKGYQLRKKKDVAGSGSQADVKSGINKTNASEASFSVFFLCLLSVCLWLRLRVLLCVVVVVSRGVCVVWCVWCAVCVCERSKRPCVYRHHAHMLQHMCAWCRQTRGRFECTHGTKPRVFYRENKCFCSS